MKGWIKPTRGRIAAGILIAAVLTWVLLAGRVLHEPGEAADPCHPRPIVLLHGHFYTNASLSVLIERLQTDGWPRDRLLTLDVSRKACTRDWSLALAEKIETVASATGCPQVDIVAHSRGGLAARDYLGSLGGAPRVAHLVTLGTPHHGARINRACPGCGCLEMRPDSDYLRRLNRGDETPGPTAYTSIYSRQDEVVPGRSAWLEGARNIEVRGVKHTDLLRSRRVYDEIRAGLM
jgi:triacylglycerol lipase